MPEAEYSCLDCGRDFAASEAMNDHIDEAHNQGYGTGTSDHRFNPAPFCAKCSGPCQMEDTQP